LEEFPEEPEFPEFPEGPAVTNPLREFACVGETPVTEGGAVIFTALTAFPTRLWRFFK